ncbi:uncharacterized protein LOC143188998 [Calliopsis andreniformis]|uniref:uncharacterized protein LOC143188998 n=1 Tax=Calliopsis andreniformis TaxID=337506 RepID=UPI003FCEAD98
MVNNNDDDSISSEDEISKDALREATDHQFLKDAYFSSAQSKNPEISNNLNKHDNLIHAENSKNIKSLRRNLEQQNKFENFGVSPSYQNYVAQKLNEIIEKSIKIKDKNKNESVVTEEIQNSSGIKLLNSSTEFLSTNEENAEFQNSSKRRKVKNTMDDKLNILKCKEVAVGPEWILSKTETKAWTNKRKEPEFKYKRLKNGTLLEQT